MSQNVLEPGEGKHIALAVLLAPFFSPFLFYTLIVFHRRALNDRRPALLRAVGQVWAFLAAVPVVGAVAVFVELANAPDVSRLPRQHAEAMQSAQAMLPLAALGLLILAAGLGYVAWTALRPQLWQQAEAP